MKPEVLFRIEMIAKKDFGDQEKCRRAALEAHQLAMKVLELIIDYNRKNESAHLNYYGAAGDPAPTNLEPEKTFVN